MVQHHWVACSLCLVTQLKMQVKSTPYDPRFPTTNQARHCYTRYNEFYRYSPATVPS